MNSGELTKLIVAQESLDLMIKSDHDAIEMESAVFQHISRFSSNPILIPQFSMDWQWINTTRPLDNNDLKGKIVVLDMFTYCCINCMHILPDLEALESEFPIESGVAVIGVHSAKFENEKIYENVISAVLRYNIHHPVINDPNGEMWNALSVACWPTVFILGPKNEVLFTLVGEGHRKKLFFYVKKCLEYFKTKNEINYETIPIKYHKLETKESSLQFPGKLSCCPNDDCCFAIADTGHHRILIVNTLGLVQHCIGGKTAGFVDGNFSFAKFHSPQGITWKDHFTLFVADTENHAIRKIDLNHFSVETVVGNGEQGNDLIGGNLGKLQSINSPWDVVIGTWNLDILLIAMAGSHQIWGYALEDAIVSNGKDVRKNSCLCLTGSGVEENRNNRFSHKAGFAQPSGLCLASRSEETFIIVADSESSTIRSVDVKTFGVSGIVGGSLDPKNLFSFGDNDGIGAEAKLQHPLDVTWDSKRSIIYVADSYNHKIKEIDFTKKKCMCTTTKSFHNFKLNEPGGMDISKSCDHLFIADTNNHRIVVADLNNAVVKELAIKFMDDLVINSKKHDTTDNVKKIVLSKPDLKEHLEPIIVSEDGDIIFEITVLLDKGFKPNNDAPNSWRFAIKNNTDMEITSSGKIQDLKAPFACHLPPPKFKYANEYSAILECKVYVCDNEGCCLLKIVHLEAQFIQTNVPTNVVREVNFKI